MRATLMIAVLAGLMLLVGCEPVVSVHPLYSEDTAAFEPDLLGCWGEEAGEDCLLRFSKRDDGGYDVTMKEDDGTESDFLARAVMLDDQLFLDLQPVQTDSSNTIHAFHFVSMHTFYRISLEEGVLLIAYLDDDWLGPELEDGSVTLAHRHGEDGDKRKVVLTEPTAGLQKFVLEYAGDDDAFPSLEPLYRLEAAAQPEE